MKRVFLSVFALFILSNVNAQSLDTAVINTVNRLFKGMKEADDSLILQCFTASAKLQSITSSPATNKVENHTFSPNEFMANLVKRSKGSYDERISKGELVIKQDGELIMAWVPYVFYLDGKFSHCGVDLFTLVKENNTYKISNLVFNMRRTGCDQ